MTGIAARLLIATALTAWAASVFAQAEQKTPEDFAATLALAEQGDAKAQREVGIHYADGPVETQDYAHARYWLQKAADQRDGAAQYRLAQLHFDGDGGPVDNARGEALMTAAAEQGLVKAQVDLAFRYREGNDVTVDGAKAVRWFTAAAAQGDPK